MLVSKRVYNYMCKQCPEFGEKVKLSKKNYIKNEYLTEIYKNDKLKKIFTDIINNMDEVKEIIKRDYKTNSPEYMRNYRRDYYKKKYNEDEKYKEDRKIYLKKRYDDNKMVHEYEYIKNRLYEIEQKMGINNNDNNNIIMVN